MHHFAIRFDLPFTVTVETKLREFQYKILNDIVYTNDKLFRFKMIESPLCTFCQKEDESLERGEEQNREEGEMTQTKLGGGRNRGEK